MIVNVLVWFVMVVLAVFLAWLAGRFWRSKNALQKWGGLILSGLLALAVGLVSVVVLIGLIKAYAPRDAEIPNLQVEGTPAQVQRGEHIAGVFCASCHSATNELPLAGGVDLGKDFPMALGSFVSVNLTPAGPLSDWTDGEIFRAVRNGIDRDGRRLTIMSSFRGRNMSDEDLQALIAYLRSQPSVENPTLDPPDQPNLLAIALFGAGMIPEGKPPTSDPIYSPTKAPTAEYGEYILGYQDCRDCHGEDLTGGLPGQLAPLGPNLKNVKSWSQEQFFTTLREGVNPSGHRLSSQMPWKNIGRMDDDELTAIYAYLQSMP